MILDNGFEVKVDEEAIKSAECFEKLGAMESGEIWAMTEVLEMILGKAQKEELYKKIRGDARYTPMDKVSAITEEIFKKLGDEVKK